MNRKMMLQIIGAGVLIGIFAGATTPALGQPGNPEKIIAGETAVIEGSTVSTWARVNEAGEVMWVGLTFPLALVENMPEHGTGPAGAIALLNYPPIVKATTYFDHLEIHSEHEGHPNNPAYAQSGRYLVPHFDFHFFGIPSSQVQTIPFGFFFDQVSADRLPKFFEQPEPLSVPQMGRHAALTSEFSATDHWLATMIIGFLPDASYMNFLEPMVTRELLLQRKSFVMQAPKPARLGRATRYPAECMVLYDKDTDSYQFIFTGFHPIQ